MTAFATRVFDHKAPLAISRIFVALGGRYTIGVMRLCSSPAAMMAYRWPEGVPDDADSTGTTESRIEPDSGLLDYEVGVEFPVRGTKGTIWTLVVAREPDRSFSVWLLSREGGKPSPLAMAHRVQSENLLMACMQIYDSARSRPSP